MGKEYEGAKSLVLGIISRKGSNRSGNYKPRHLFVDTVENNIMAILTAFAPLALIANT